MDITKSKDQTKKWRNHQVWYTNGKHRECEKYQLDILKTLIDGPLHETRFMRLNINTGKLVQLRMPMTRPDGYDYTEDFDASFSYKRILYLINLKFVCSKGGAQTRSLREVYHFIRAQVKAVDQYPNIVFVNILDGDEAYRNIGKFRHIESSPKIFVGDLTEFTEWWKVNKTRSDILEQMKFASGSLLGN